MSTSAFQIPSTMGNPPERRLDLLENNTSKALESVGNALGVGGLWTQVSVKALYTARPWDLVLCNPTAGGFYVGLPAPKDCIGAQILIKNDSDSTNTITIAPRNSKVDGAVTRVINTPRAALWFVSTGTEWKLIGREDTIATPGLTISTATITADQNDYTQTSWDVASLLRVTTDATLHKFTGFASATATVALKELVNIGADPFLLAHENTGSAAANRILCPNGIDLPVMPGMAVRLVYDSVSARWRASPFSNGADQPVALLEVPFATSNGGSNDVSISIPASPSGNGRFLFKDFEVWSAGIGGSDAGTVTLTLGASAGGTEYMLAKAITSATTGGIQGGTSLASRGTSMLINNGYRAALNASDAIHLKAATTVGTVSSGKKARCFIYGSFQP